MKEKITAIVPAAGIGKRLGPGTNKPFHPLLDKPLVVWTIEALEGIDEIGEIIPVIKEPDMEEGMEIFERYAFPKVKRIAPGGRERQDSVYSGLKLVGAGTEIVLIHDGVRPFINGEIVRGALAALKGFDGAVAAVPVKDTIKEAADTIVQRTLKREVLWAVQTPQVFRYDVIMKAYDRAASEGVYATDDSALVERIGGKVKIVMGSYHNIKITTPEDIPVAEFLLREGTRKSCG